MLKSLRNIRIFIESRRKRRSEDSAQEHNNEDSLLLQLPVDVLLLLLSFLSPRDLCRLGATCHYWRSLVRDPLIWRFFLIRDASSWRSVDHLSTPRLQFLTDPAGGDTDTEEETQTLDYMAEYLRCCPDCRSVQRVSLSSSLSFFLSVVREAEPRFCMFGSGLEQLEVSLMTVMMNSPNVLTVTESTQRQINGIGSGISFVYDGQHRFNIITLYSTNSAERERARVEGVRVNSKLFVHQEVVGSRPVLRLDPQFQEVFCSAHGLIYVTNAETDSGVREDEYAQISAVVQPVLTPPTRPLLVLSCVSRDEETRRKSVCVSVAHQLQLHLLHNPWMVQDVVADSLSGLLEGMSWLLRHTH